MAAPGGEASTGGDGAIVGGPRTHQQVAAQRRLQQTQAQVDEVLGSFGRRGYQNQAFDGGHEEPDMDFGPPHDQEVMVHGVPETNRLKWNHIEDLDSFFTRVYNYHQKHGFVCIVTKEVFSLLQFIFVVGFFTFLVECVDYPVLFKDKNVHGNDTMAKVTLHDALIPMGQCVSGFGFYMWTTLILGGSFWIIRLIFMVYNTTLNWEIRSFYRSALGILDEDLDNMTWYDLQKKLREVQREQQMCIHKQDLTELDLYHRILRFKNYLIAMTNKNLLPLRFTLPFVGDTIFLSHGLKYNLELILFWGPWAPFEKSWHLREDYKKVSKRKELAEFLRKRIVLVAAINLILSPFIFLWQILYSFFNYGEVVKREPGTLGTRRWSLYGRLYLRHFNELEHEINARLSRAYRPAAKYMSIFISPLLVIIAQNVMFMAGAFLVVFSSLAIWDDDVLAVEHVILIITTCTVIITICSSFIPDEQLVWNPEGLLIAVLAHIHYFPGPWKGHAHKLHTRNELSLLFQYKAVYLLEELLSPIITPMILYCRLRHKSLDIVDFYRNFTVGVIGVGDVCSFAQMDVRKHGNPDWQTSTYDMEGSMDQPTNNNNAYTQAENGKTELSLVHFTHTNPDWLPPNDSGTYITTLKETAARDAALPTVTEEKENAFYASLNSVSSFGNEYSDVVANLMRENNFLGNRMQRSFDDLPVPAEIAPTFHTESSAPSQHTSFRGYLNRHEGPMQRSYNRGIVSGTQQSVSNSGIGISFAESYAQRPTVRQHTQELNHTVELNAIDMSLDALYIHNLHHREMEKRSEQSTSTRNYAPLSGSTPVATRTDQGHQSQAVISQYQFMPQVHSFPPQANLSSTSSSSGDSVLGRQSEKTSLLSTKYSNYNKDHLS